MAEQQYKDSVDNGGGKAPLPFHFSTPTPNNIISSPTPYNTNPALYDVDKIAYQSGARNMWNSFIQGINQTQIGTSQYDLFNNRKRIADIEGGTTYRGKLQTLESDFLAKSIDEMSYLNQKNQLLSELGGLYSDNERINASILGDNQDIQGAPVSKSYQIRQQILQGIGSEAGTLESLIYTQPSVMGSSAATMGATIAVSFGTNFAKQVASRVAASVISGPAAPVVATGLTLASVASALYYARDLESRAEVGGAIEEDYQRNKEAYLYKTGKREDELTPQEENELINQSYKGADKQYWKNMSLAAVDALQALVLGAGVSKWFANVANVNKFTRAGFRLGEYYVGAKSESVEEGLQYAFQKEKNEASINNIEQPAGFNNFINGLRQDYVDVLGSLDYGPIKGNGKYSEDKDFQFATDSGFLMGAILGGSASVIRTAKDLYNYRDASKELQKAGLENTEGNIFKFNTQIYKSFFEPSTGIFGEASEDRVHYLREGIKAMGKKKDANGEPIMTQEEVRTELENVGEAYRTYDKLRGYLDNIRPSYKAEDAKMYKLASSKFEDAIFTESMQKVFNTKNLSKSQQTQSTAVATLDPNNATLVNLSNQVKTIDRRINQINQLQVGEDIRNKKIKYLEGRKKNITSQLNEEIKFLKDAGQTIGTIPEAGPELTAANADLLTQEMYASESNERYNNLLKINSFKKLSDWFITTAQEEARQGLTGSIEALQAQRAQEYADLANIRKQYDLLTPEEETTRQAENKAILAREGFTQAEIDTMGYEALEKSVNDIISTYAKGGLYLNENRQYQALSQVKSQDDYQKLFDNPGFQNFIDTNFPNTTRDTAYTEVAKQASDFLTAQRAGTPKKALPPTARSTYSSVGRPKMPSDNRTSAEIQAGFAVKDGKSSQSLVLANIIGSPYSTEAEKALAMEFLDITEADDVILFKEQASAGAFDANNNTVTIDTRYSSFDYEGGVAPIETVILHELVHKYTVAPLQSDPNSDLSQRLTNLFNFVSDQARRKNVFDKFYGLTNKMEFLTEAMTNPEFQQFLKGINYTVRNKTTWEAFLDLVNTALKSLGITVDQTALDEVVSVTSGLAGRVNRESFTSIRARFESKINNDITSTKSADENVTAAEELYKELYDTPELSPAEFNILKDAITDKLEVVNKALKAKDKDLIKFGKWSFLPGEFLVPTEKNYVYTAVKQNTDKSVIVSYEFIKDKKKQSGSKTLSNPGDIAQVFTEKNAAIDFIKGRQPKPTGTQATPEQGTPVSDSFGKALDEFIAYAKTKFNYGNIDPKLIELGNTLIQEAVKLGKTNFRDISAEIIGRVGQDEYKNVFTNLRAVYNALFATTNGLDDLDVDMTNLVIGRTTAESIIDSLNPPTEETENTFTGGTGTDKDNITLTNKNAKDKISGSLLKSTGQQFATDENGMWTRQVDTDPVKSRYYAFVNKMAQNNVSMSQQGFYGLLVQDEEELKVAGVAIPHEQNTVNYINDLKSKNKRVVLGQVVVIANKEGIPVKFDQQGNVNENGEPIIFNIESVDTTQKKDVSIVAKLNGVSEDAAKELIRTTANKVSAIRDSAKSGQPVLLDLSPKAGVPLFTESLNAASPLSTQNVIVEVANVQKDDTNIGYFTQHPNQTGFLGGAYAFVNGIPIKIEPNALTEAGVNLVVQILDEQTGNNLGEDIIKARSKFLQELVYQRYTTDKTKQQGTLYFKGSDIYLNGAKVPKADRKAVLQANARYNIVSYLLNKNWSPYVLKDGKVVKVKAVKYNEFILARSSTHAAFNNSGQQELVNSYLTYTPNRVVEKFVPNTENLVELVEPIETHQVSALLERPFAAKTPRGGKHIPVEVLLRELDIDKTGIDDLEDSIRAADSVSVTLLKVNGATRTGKIFLDFGEASNSGSVELPVTFKPLPSAPKASPLERVEASPVAERPDTLFNIGDKFIEVDNNGNQVGIYKITGEDVIFGRTNDWVATEQVTNDITMISKTEIKTNKYRKIESGKNPKSNKDRLLAEIKAKNEAAKQNSIDIAKDIQDQMTSLGRSIDLVSNTDKTVDQTELDWFSNTFFKDYKEAGRELQITSDIVNSNLWGEFSENGIKLYQDAPQGTLYHEAWHEFTQVYLTLDEKQKLYNDARKIKGQAGKSDLEVEEFLAESFRNYVLTGKTPVAQNLFQRILTYIKNIFFGTTDVNTLFERLRKGKINNYLPNISNIQFKRLNSGITSSLGESLFDATQSLTVVRSIDRLIYDFIHAYGKNVIDTLSQPKILQAAYKAAYKGFNDSLIKLRNDYAQKIEGANTDAEIDALDSELQKSEEKFTRVTNNWNDVMAYHGQHSRTFVIRNNQIKFAFDETGNIVEENDDADLERAKNSYEGLAGNEISSIDGANKETRALVRGLGKSTYSKGEIIPQTNIFGIQELVDFGSTWNNIAITLQGTMEVSDMVSKLEAMIPAFPEYRELIGRLLDVQVSVNQVSQVAKFRQDFSRSYLGVYELVFNPEEGIYKLIESTKNNIDAIENEFLDNFVTSSVNAYIKRDEYGSNMLTSEIKNLPINSLDERISFLSAIGVKLSSSALNDPLVNEAVSGRAVSAIKNSLIKLIDSGIKVSNPLGQIKNPNSGLGLKGEAGNINKILRLESKYSRNNATASMQNASGDTVYALSLNNLLTVTNAYLSDVAKYPTYQDVVTLPHMKHLDYRNNPYVKNSIWLNEMFDLDETSSTFGNRKSINGQPVVMTLINFNGLKIEKEQGSSEGEVTTGLWIGDKLVQDFNALLTAGVKEMMRAGDKASAFGVRLTGYNQAEGREDKLPIKIESFAQGFGGVDALNIFSGYLTDELTRMRSARTTDHGKNLDYYKGTASKFNLFRDILDSTLADAISADLNSEASIDEIVSKHQKNLSTSLRAFFNKQVEDKVNSLANYQFETNNPTWVDLSLIDKYNINQLLRAYVVNAFTLNVEQTKIFNGDGAFYKAFHKRNSKDTSTGTTMMTDQWFLDWLNDHHNTNLQSKLIGVNNEVTNITNTAVFQDNTVASAYTDIYRKQLTDLGLPTSQVDDIVSKYEGANEGDAQGWITLDFYRTFKLSQGKWYPQHEAIYEKASKGLPLTLEETFYFMPIKAQYAGPLDYDGVFAPAFHKFSLVPLLPALIKGTKMEAMNEKMIRNNVGYGLFESGSKVATILNEDGAKDKFYNDYKERTPVDPNDAFTAINPIFNHYLKEQVNIEPSLHDEVIYGTQFRKLLFQNLFNGGKALSPKWEKLYESYNHTIDQLVANEKQRLLEELGIEETKTGYKNVDFIKLVDKFVKEANRRDMNMNVTSFMEFDKDSNAFKYPLDASINRQQIQNMIMSIINNRLVRQHTNGDLMVQVAGSGFEKYEKPTDAQTDQYGSNGLRFYHLKDGKTQSMQVKVPLNGDFVNLLYYTHPDGEVINTIQRLNEALTNETWVEQNRKSIQMIGYRIPTQGLNSIEFMEIAEFLPAEAGNILILPTEIVIKAGSDFDIDKLSIFKPAIRVRFRDNKKTGERTIEQVGYVEPKFYDLSVSIETRKEKLKAEYDPKINALKDKLTALRVKKEFDIEDYNTLRNQLEDSIIGDEQPLVKVNVAIRNKELDIKNKKGDIRTYEAQTGIDGFDSESADALFVLRDEVRDLELDLAILYDDLEKIQQNLRGQLDVDRVLLDAADQYIRSYLDSYYEVLTPVVNELESLRTEYFNELENLRAYKKGLQNNIIEIGRQVLEDQSNFVQLITPNDTGLIKPMITDQGGIKQKNGYPLKTDYTGTAIYTEKTQEEKFLAGLVGKKALGIAAVNNTFTQLFEQIGLQVNSKFLDGGKRRQIFMRLLDNPTQDSFDFSNVVDEKGILKSEFISQMINAYVDVLNDDFIFYANAGLEVAPLVFYLKNAGVSTEKIFYFINHPVIKYYINQLQATKSYIHKATNPEQYDQKVRQLTGQSSYGNELFKSLVGTPSAPIERVRALAITNANENPGLFSEKTLLDRISRPITEISFLERSAILGYFLQIQKEANLLRKFQAANSYDTSTAATPIDSQNFEILKQEVEDSGFISPEYQTKISNTVIKPFNVTDFISSMFDSLMPVTLGKQMINYILNHYEGLEDQDRYRRLFTNDLMSFIFSNYVTLDRLPNKPTAFEYVNGNSTTPSMFDKTVSLKDGGLIARLKNLKSSPAGASLRAEYPIINQIRIVTTEKSNFANITIYRGENTTDTQNSLIEQFDKLANFSDPAYTPAQQNFIRKTFKDLALFGFAQSGLNKSPISFTDIVPNDLYTPLMVQGIEKFKQDVAKRGFEVVMFEYSNLFRKNNPELMGTDGAFRASYKYKNYKRERELTLDEFRAATQEPYVQPPLFYGNLAIQPENRILDSRNSSENLEVDTILNQFTEQSKPCNS